MYSAEFDALFALDGSGVPVQSANYGFYGYLESNVYQEADNPLQGLNIFVRAGTAEDDVNQFDMYVGSGLVYTGLIPGRDDDQVGLAMAMAQNGDAFNDANTDLEDYELTIEGTYRFQVNPWLVVQPDIQYVINPGTSTSVDNALVIGTRFGIVI